MDVRELLDRASGVEPLGRGVSDAERASHTAFVSEMDTPLWKTLGLIPEGFEPLS
jgi:hypothetical protein